MSEPVQITIPRPVHGNCLPWLCHLPAASVDMAFVDPPYGITVAEWDSIIDIPQMFGQIFRVVRPDGAVVVTANQPFSSRLVVEFLDAYRCEWVWDKTNPTNFPNAKRQPLRQHEQVLVFSKKPHRYHPQMVEGKPNHGWKTRDASGTTVYAQRERAEFRATSMKYPKTIVCFPKHSSQSKLHPTQKPLDLVRYFIRTYSRPGDLVLDSCVGSGTTLVAAMAEYRNAIGAETDPKFFATACSRIEHWNRHERDVA